jgi:hypothetical protein
VPRELESQIQKRMTFYLCNNFASLTHLSSFTTVNRNMSNSSGGGLIGSSKEVIVRDLRHIIAILLQEKQETETHGRALQQRHPLLLSRATTNLCLFFKSWVPFLL